MEPWDESYLFAAFGLLAVLLLSEDDPDPKVVDLLISWLVPAHDEIIDWHSHGYFGPVPTFMHFPNGCINRKIWQKLVVEVQMKRGNDPTLSPFLARISLPTSLKTQARKVAFYTKMAFWISGDLISMLWKNRRKG